jgi:hypothetical protein
MKVTLSGLSCAGCTVDDPSSATASLGRVPSLKLGHHT